MTIGNRYHITVELGEGIHPDVRGPLLLEFERVARRFTGKPIEVFMHRMGDDSKLRTLMTAEERAKL